MIVESHFFVLIGDPTMDRRWPGDRTGFGHGAPIQEAAAAYTCLLKNHPAIDNSGPMPSFALWQCGVMFGVWHVLACFGYTYIYNYIILYYIILYYILYYIYIDIYIFTHIHVYVFIYICIYGFVHRNTGYMEDTGIHGKLNGENDDKPWFFLNEILRLWNCFKLYGPSQPLL